mmetsp:Transcript_165459/g.530911  ORF Transcript_165459/g.530911 Transcript_165459/m.530911 type:complete len:104 (+) Transcript_165459:2155-2466(+)
MGCWHFTCVRNAPQTKIARSRMQWCFGLSVCVGACHGMLALHMFAKCSADDREEQMQWCFDLSVCMNTRHGMSALHVSAKCSADQGRAEGRVRASSFFLCGHS